MNTLFHAKVTDYDEVNRVITAMDALGVVYHLSAYAFIPSRIWRKPIVGESITVIENARHEILAALASTEIVEPATS